MLEHLATFWEVRDEANVQMFHYSDLLGDLEGEFRRLAAGLGIEVDERKVPELVGAARFDSMRDNAEKLAPEVKTDGFWNDTNRFFHVGSSGQWSEFIGPHDVERYETRVSLLAPPDLAAWAHGGKEELTSA